MPLGNSGENIWEGKVISQQAEKLGPEMNLRIYRNLGHTNSLSTKNEMAICDINCLVEKIAADKNKHTVMW